MSAADGMLGRALANAAANSDPVGLVGRDHPDTSVAAAVQAGRGISRSHGRVLLALAKVGEYGATAAELEANTGLGGNTIRPRLIELTGRRADMAELAAEPLVVRTDIKRKNYGGRTSSYVYRLTVAGERAARELAAER